MEVLYCIPGMGVDERIFSQLVPRLQWQGDIRYLNHLEPAHPRETIAEYAQRLRQTLPDAWQTPPTLIGMSMGGMIANELARLIPYQRLFVISSIKEASEVPFYFKFLRQLPAHRLVPSDFSKRYGNIIARMTGAFDKQYLDLVFDMFRARSNEHFAWARNAAIQWTPPAALPNNLIHLHGTRDHIFTPRRVQPTHWIDNGTHNMILENADTIATLINSYLQQGS